MHDPHPFNFYMFGCELHPIGSVRGGTAFRDNIELITQFRDAGHVCTYLSLNPFCKQNLPSAADKADQIGVLLRTYCSPENGNPIPDSILDEDADYFRKNVLEFETILGDELSKLPIFCLEDEKIGNFAIAKLLNGASNGYPVKAKTRITPPCKSEIDEAGKCLVYERSTAAGFHALRSVEVTIRQYLFSIPGFAMPPLNRQNWGEYLTLLKNNGAARDVTDHLHNMKDNYRNPLMHPEDSLEIDEAVSLFAVAQSMNEMLITDMLKRGLIK